MRENKKSKDTGIPTALLRVTSWVVVFCAFLYATTVHADNGPHGGYTAATDACAGCHRAHTAATETLLLNTVPDLCYTCHGSSAAGADTNVVDGTYDGLESGSGEGVVDHGLKGGGVQNALMDTDVLTTTTATITATTSSHMVDGSTGTLWGSGSITSTFYAGLTDFSLSCISCHNPHGGGTYRILRPIPTDSGASDPVIVDDEVSKNYTVSASDNTYMGQTYGGISPQLANWCSQCHTRYLADSGSGHTDSGDTIYKYRHTTTSVSCVQCHVAHGSSAKMGTFSGAVLWPDNTIAPSGDSRSSLLRLDSRGVCAYCHLNQLGNVGGGSCDSCHNLPQGDRRAVVPDGTNPNDFGNTSHHVNGPVQNSDCTVCHYTGNHMGGIVNLNDPDGGNIYSFDPGNPAALEIFCLNCHDTDGALAFGGTRPFSDGQLVPDIEGSEIKTPGSSGVMWANSAHKTEGYALNDNNPVSCFGDGSTNGCHGNSHGSSNVKLISDEAGMATIGTFCFRCHTEGKVMNDALSNNRPGGYVSADDIEEAFAKTEKHNLGTVFTVGSDDFTIQCTSCHNPHVVTGKYWEPGSGVTPVTRPDFSDPVNNPRAMGKTLWGDDVGEKMSDFAAQASGTGGWYYSTARGENISWDQPAAYRPPKSGDGYEAEFSGDILPDYTTLCLDCHTYRMSAANPPVNWGQGIGCTDNSVDPPDQRIECGAQHGLGAANNPSFICPEGSGHKCEWWGGSGNPDVAFQVNYVTRGRNNGHFMRWPYDSTERAAGINFVMSCTDCHEAHGSNRGGIIRERFNVNSNGDCGTGGDTDPNGENCSDGGNWNSYCNACHYYYGGQHSGMSCGNASCHEANSPHRIIHVTGSGSTQLRLTQAGYESNYQPPDFTPAIEIVEGHIGSDQLSVTFRASQYGAGSQGIFANSDLTGALSKEDFWVFDSGNDNQKTISSVLHTPGSYYATITLSSPLIEADLSNDTLALKPASVWGWYEGGYNNPGTGIIAAQAVSAGPWPVVLTGLPGVSLTSVEGISGYDRLYVQFSEPVYANSNGTGTLAPDDFTYVDINKSRIISDVIHVEGETTATLILNSSLDLNDDIGVDTLAAVSNAIYDEYGNLVGADPVIVRAKADTLSLTLLHGVDAHDRIIVRFSNRTYANADATGSLQPSDFVYTDSNGKSIIGVEHEPGRPSAAIILDGSVDGANDFNLDTLAPAGGSIFDISGYPAPIDPITLAEASSIYISSIASVEGVIDSVRLKVTFQTQVYSAMGETGALQVSDFVLNAGGKTIDSVQHAPGSEVAIISMTQSLTDSDLGASTLAPASSSIFGPSPGNFPLGTDAVTINAQAAPAITKVEGAVGQNKLAVFFSEGVYGGRGQSGALQAGDFDLNAGTKSISEVGHFAGSSTAIITMTGNLENGDLGAATLAAASDAIFNSINNPVGSGGVIITANDCPTWGASFQMEDEPQSSATTVDESGLLIATVGNPSFAFSDPLDNDVFNGDEDEDTWVDINTNKSCLNVARGLTVESRVKPTEVDRGVGDNTFNRIFARRGTFKVTILNTDYRGDDISTRSDKASIEIKYRSNVRQVCPHPQWPDDNYEGNAVWMHQISSDINNYPLYNDHWYLIKVVFNSDKSDIVGTNGTPVDIFIDDQGTDGTGTGEVWTGYKNASLAIRKSSSCKWGALPGDGIRIKDFESYIGADYCNSNNANITCPSPFHSQLFEGQIDWVTWLPYADYSGVDDPPY